jgi:hypothetical protein
MTTLDGMTWETWQRLPESQRSLLRDNRSLTQELVGLEGYRVEVVDSHGEKRRFIVGRSTGWQPIHIELSKRTSSGGIGVMGAPFKSVRKLYRVR